VSHLHVLRSAGQRAGRCLWRQGAAAGPQMLQSKPQTDCCSCVSTAAPGSRLGVAHGVRALLNRRTQGVSIAELMTQHALLHPFQHRTAGWAWRMASGRCWRRLPAKTKMRMTASGTQMRMMMMMVSSPMSCFSLRCSMLPRLLEAAGVRSCGPTRIESLVCALLAFL